MRRIFLFAILIFLSFWVNAQHDHVNWSSSIENKGNNEFEVTISAELLDHWHLYSQFLPMDAGPMPTWLDFQLNNNFELIGEAEESETNKYFDKTWEAEIIQFEDHAQFTQRIKVINDSVKTFSGVVRYMICKDDVGCIGNQEYAFNLSLETGKESVPTDTITGELALSTIPNPKNVDLANPINDCGGGGATEEDKKSYWWILLLGLGGGLVSLVTPCVFPMIPLTVSFFTKGGKDKGGIAKALLYGLSIVGVYVSLSIPFHFGAESEILNNISTNFTLNIIFFLIFLFFAFSFFGYYEIGLPASWANKADKAADVGGFIGIVFMALVLAIVSFSCTGPLLGSVLAGSLTAEFDPWLVSIAMLGFGVGLGLPFTIFAAFPSLLKSLPQSGGWLNTVKVTLGFVELGMALKFASNADFVYRFGVVHRETFFLIWIILALLCAIYLFGIIFFPHDSRGVKIGTPRKVIAIIFAAFAIYLIPGVLPQKSQPWNPTLISGFPPSTWYSWYGGERHFTDYYEALAYAKEMNKPLLVDFTGYACVNCRKMEENVWPQLVVENELNNYVIVSLYVDDKVSLPKELQGVVPIPGPNGTVKQKTLTTVGDRWATFESIVFGQVSQPYYVLLSPDEYLLNNPVGYNSNAQEYANWLKCGLEAFDKLKSGEFNTSTVNEEGVEKAPVIAEEIIAATWSYEVSPLGDDEYEVSINAAINEGWHLYSQFLDGAEGPLPTWIQFTPNDAFELIGVAEEPNVHKVYDPTWEMDILQFEGNASFVQKIKVKGALPIKLNGTIDYMACDDGKCVNFQETFEVEIK